MLFLDQFGAEIIDQNIFSIELCLLPVRTSEKMSRDIGIVFWNLLWTFFFKLTPEPKLTGSTSTGPICYFSE